MSVEPHAGHEVYCITDVMNCNAAKKRKNQFAAKRKNQGAALMVWWLPVAPVLKPFLANLNMIRLSAMAATIRAKNHHDPLLPSFFFSSLVIMGFSSTGGGMTSIVASLLPRVLSLRVISFSPTSILCCEWL